MGAVRWLGFDRMTAWWFWRNTFRVLFARPASLEAVFSLMVLYVHLGKQAEFLVQNLERRIARLEGTPASDTAESHAVGDRPKESRLA